MRSQILTRRPDATQLKAGHFSPERPLLKGKILKGKKRTAPGVEGGYGTRTLSDWS
ncbi:MAG: hypothetical protein U0105_03865 [Candidatus Obscuribacterales bacterium]